MPLPSFMNRQRIVLINCIFGNLFCAMTYSLQSPFYPKEAMKRGVSVSAYGLVFSVYELTVLVSSPIFGLLLRFWTIKTVLTGGLLLSGLSCVCFSLLDMIHDGSVFLGLSFLIRILEALGQAAYFVSSVTAIVLTYSENVGGKIAILETFFSVGSILGPSIGGLMYRVGGFSTPFISIGLILILSTIVAFLSWPPQEEEYEDDTSVVAILKIPSIWIGVLAVFVGSCCAGFLQSTLEPHIRSFHLDPALIGCVFALPGLVYALTTPLWNFLCKRCIHPRGCMAISGVLRIVAFSLIGPFPFFSTTKDLCAILFGLVINGLAIGGQFISGFLDPLRVVHEHGFQENIRTSSLITCVWRSSFSLGGLVGPSCAGFLYDRVGFRKATLFVMALNYALIAIAVYSISRKPITFPRNENEDLSESTQKSPSKSIQNEKTPLLS